MTLMARLQDEVHWNQWHREMDRLNEAERQRFARMGRWQLLKACWFGDLRSASFAKAERRRRKHTGGQP